MTTDTGPRGGRGSAQPSRPRAQGVRGAGQAPRARGVQGGRPPGQMLLRAAEELFGERSYHRTTVADICARAGMATGSFYSYYGSKAEIFAAVVRGINDDLRQAMRAALEHAEGGQRARERAAFRAYFDMLSERPWNRAMPTQLPNTSWVVCRTEGSGDIVSSADSSRWS